MSGLRLTHVFSSHTMGCGGSFAIPPMLLKHDVHRGKRKTLRRRVCVSPFILPVQYGKKLSWSWYHPEPSSGEEGGEGGGGRELAM